MDEPAERISTEKAMQLLKDDGVIVNEEQAKIILNFLCEMSEIVVDQYFKQRDIDNN
jgi:endonuclease III-like uncharacterized protein